MITELVDGIKRRIGVALTTDQPGEQWLLTHIRGMQRFVIEWEKRAGAAPRPIRCHATESPCTKGCVPGECVLLEITRLTAELQSAESRAVKAQAALRELVRLKDLHDEIERLDDPMNWRRPDRLHELEAEYQQRKPLAWEAARKAVALPLEGGDAEREKPILGISSRDDGCREEHRIDIPHALANGDSK